jgi:predicted RNase H-like HicB family nuclease
MTNEKREIKMSETKLPAYSMRVFWSAEDDAFIAACPELHGISAFGVSPEEAAKELRQAITLAVDVMVEDGDPLPEAATLHDYSGQLRLRMPKSLHARLSDDAEAEGVSLNSLIVTRLAESVGSHTAVNRFASGHTARSGSRAVGTRPSRVTR